MSDTGEGGLNHIDLGERLPRRAFFRRISKFN
jgi:hypothetical protein